jgi:hypothetical protein
MFGKLFLLCILICMKYFFWIVLILTLAFTLPPWVTFSAAVFLVFLKKIPFLSISIIGIVLDVMYRVQLFEIVPLYSLLGFSISLVMPWIFRRLAW